jgi:hypothetical protein
MIISNDDILYFIKQSNAIQNFLSQWISSYENDAKSQKSGIRKFIQFLEFSDNVKNFDRILQANT